MKRMIIAACIYFLTAAVALASEGKPIFNRYKNKIVYTQDTSENSEGYRKDCEQKGGMFNECGSICDENEKEPIPCPAVCAYTCEFGN